MTDLNRPTNLDDPSFLREWFEYDQTSPSCLKWKKRRPYSSAKAGDFITYKTAYWTVEICQKRIRCHRIILILHGHLPQPGEIVDHVNRDKLDNRIENLRWVKYCQNNANKPVSASSGWRYVAKTPDGRFRSQYRIPMTGRTVCCGTYDSPMKAQAAALAHRLENYWRI